MRATDQPQEQDVQSAMKQAMRSYPQGVTVLTTADKAGLKGITVSSFISVSLTPPLVLVSIAKGSALHDQLASAESYAVNFLADDQKSVSDRFAGRTSVSDRFRGIKYQKGSTGSPIIAGVRAVVECKAWKVYDGGDHSILVGEVVSARTFNSKRPLVYYSQQYTTTELQEYPAPPSDIVW
jgi:flavin reductase (DIM6/NTAB) family NADH-FMN oxidoreductase RutF